MMATKKGWDLTSLGSLHGAAEWIRKQAGGVLVLVVRGEDVAFAVDPAVSPASAREMVEFVMPEVERQLIARRQEAKARVKAKQMGAMQ